MHRFSEGMYSLFLQHCLHSSQTPHGYWGGEKKKNEASWYSISEYLLPTW